MKPKSANSTCIDHHFPFKECLTFEQKDHLVSNCNILKYSKGENIFKQSAIVTDITFLVSGFIKLIKETRHHKKLIINLVKPGEFLNIMSALSGEFHHYSAEAIEGTEVCHLNIANFKQLLQENSMFAYEMVKKQSQEEVFLLDRLMNQFQKQLPGRIADVLLYFSEKIFHSDYFAFPLTREELAELAGTTKESFIRTLSEFRNDKIIELNGKTVLIKSYEIIRTLSKLG